MPPLKKNLLQLPDNNFINKENNKTIKESKEEDNSINSIDEDIKQLVKQYAGIWDDDEDDVDENDVKENDTKKEGKNTYKKDRLDEIDESISESENISKMSDKKEVNKSKDKSNSDKNKNMNIKKNRNEIIYKSRLDKDFKNLEKIGQGGFGIVLKGEHRLDKGVCAIKIIKLKDINDKDSIVNEAITMTKLTSKHIVQYKTCWIDNNLGSASKLFYEDDDYDPESISLNVSRSEAFHKKNKNTIIDDESEDNDDDSNDSNLSKDEEKDNSKFSRIIKNKDDNSQELEKTKNRSKYCCNYRDDSHIGTTSIISNRYINESKVDSEKLFKGEYFFILMEYCDGLTLDKYILQYEGKSIDRKIIYNFMSQILKSLVKIHSSGIIHRDIKPCNIFIKNDQIKIGDFGLATRYSNTGKLLKSKKIEGTPLYLSPEQKNFKTYNEKVDIYACGITLYEMVSCFSTSMERFDEIMKLKNHNIINERIVKNYPEESALIKLMTKDDYNERPSAKDILESELFIKLGKSLGY
jgi:serine/threonine protein kinase